MLRGLGIIWGKLAHPPDMGSIQSLSCKHPFWPHSDTAVDLDALQHSQTPACLPREPTLILRWPAISYPGLLRRVVPCSSSPSQRRAAPYLLQVYGRRYIVHITTVRQSLSAQQQSQSAHQLLQLVWTNHSVAQQ